MTDDGAAAAWSPAELAPIHGTLTQSLNAWRYLSAHPPVMVSEGGDQKTTRGKTFAIVGSIIVAVLGLLSSSVWGPPICRAVWVCTAAPPPVTSSGPSTPGTSPARRAEGTGYPAKAGDYCEELVRAWQDQYQDRVADLSTAQIAATVFKVTPPNHYRSDWGPTGNGAVCTITDTDRGNNQVIQIFITKPTGQPGAITSVII